MFTEDKIDWSEKWVAQGREEGREEGRAEGREEGRAEARAETLAVTRKMLVSFVQARFGGSLADRVSALLAKISDLQTVLEIGEWLPACDNPEVLLNRLESV